MYIEYTHAKGQSRVSLISRPLHQMGLVFFFKVLLIVKNIYVEYEHPTYNRSIFDRKYCLESFDI